MKTAIFYYTGTGNSLWTAKTLAKGLGDSELISISSWMKEKKAAQAERIGLVFPVHMWGVPPPIVRFVQALKAPNCRFFFAVGVNAGQVSNALVQLKKLLSNNNLRLEAGFEIKMPSNYIPGGGPGPKDKLDLVLAAAGQKVERMINSIQTQEKGHLEKGPLWQRIVYTLLYKLSYAQVPNLDGSFRVDEKCNGCGTCRKVCPADNITMTDGKPVWNHHCEQCLACLQWCPQEAIQYGQKSAQYARYHHPEIQLKDVLKSQE